MKKSKKVITNDEKQVVGVMEDNVIDLDSIIKNLIENEKIIDRVTRSVLSYGDHEFHLYVKNKLRSILND